MVLYISNPILGDGFMLYPILGDGFILYPILDPQGASRLFWPRVGGSLTVVSRSGLMADWQLCRPWPVHKWRWRAGADTPVSARTR
ncbi:hypothetical protein RRG08_052113 [Elysia crispata]|uniref:Uncharacterized protein n=1 Tax=Elysia crispata TaxID=231223 RepID=A0AAE1A4D0_9GAST|nr:hypothetical protein RRG08_052113 [Elysia crispata]